MRTRRRAYRGCLVECIGRAVRVYWPSISLWVQTTFHNWGLVRSPNPESHDFTSCPLLSSRTGFLRLRTHTQPSSAQHLCTLPGMYSPTSCTAVTVFPSAHLTLHRSLPVLPRQVLVTFPHPITPHTYAASKNLSPAKISFYIYLFSIILP